MTHIIQPLGKITSIIRNILNIIILDVNIFGPVKTKLRAAIHHWHSENVGKVLNRVIVIRVARPSIDAALKKEIIIRSFKLTGLCPFNPDAPNREKLKAGTIFSHDPPVEPSHPAETETTELVEVLVTDTDSLIPSQDVVLGVEVPSNSQQPLSEMTDIASALEFNHSELSELSLSLSPVSSNLDNSQPRARDIGSGTSRATLPCTVVSGALDLLETLPSGYSQTPPPSAHQTDRHKKHVRQLDTTAERQRQNVQMEGRYIMDTRSVHFNLPPETDVYSSVPGGYQSVVEARGQHHRVTSFEINDGGWAGPPFTDEEPHAASRYSQELIYKPRILRESGEAPTDPPAQGLSQPPTHPPAQGLSQPSTHPPEDTLEVKRHNLARFELVILQPDQIVLFEELFKSGKRFEVSNYLYLSWLPLKLASIGTEEENLRVLLDSKMPKNIKKRVTNRRVSQPMGASRIDPQSDEYMEIFREREAALEQKEKKKVEKIAEKRKEIVTKKQSSEVEKPVRKRGRPRKVPEPVETLKEMFSKRKR